MVAVLITMFMPISICCAGCTARTRTSDNNSREHDQDLKDCRAVDNGGRAPINHGYMGFTACASMHEIIIHSPRGQYLKDGRAIDNSDHAPINLILVDHIASVPINLGRTRSCD